MEVRQGTPEISGFSVRLSVFPVDLAEANAFVRLHHRHHGPTVGHKFSLGARVDDKCVAMIICGRPVARMEDDGYTIEVLRLASDGTRNACSFLYRAAWRVAKEMGYKRGVTRILNTEEGASLRGAGWVLVGPSGGGSWSVPSRPRIDKHPTQGKLLWEVRA
jgi:hypothetical protein